MLNTFSGRPASQNEYELRAFIAVLQAHNVTRYLEIGTRHGDTFHEVMINLPEGSVGIALDLPGGLWGTQKSVVALNSAISDLRVRGYRVQSILGDSKDPHVANLIRDLGPFDAILIDGDHRYAGVKSDWQNYRAPIVAFHDIVGIGQIERVHNNSVEVPILWQEIAAQHDCETFIAPGSAMGIGVCYLPS